MKRNTHHRHSPFASTVLVVNPSRYPRYVKILRRIVKDYPFAEVIESRDREHFQQSVREFYASDCTHLLVWGGDGTAHAAINAIMQSEHRLGSEYRKAVGFLRGGTGNGIQDSYDVPFSIRAQLSTYAESLHRDFEIDVDLLELENGGHRLYGQLVGFGFDVDVLRRREKRRREGRGQRAVTRVLDYAAAAGQVYLGKGFRLEHPFHVSLRDGKYAFRGTRVNAEFAFHQVDRDIAPTMIEAGTRPYYGNMFKVCPDVVCNDGNMDVYMFNFRTKSAVLTNMSDLWRGNHEHINRRLTRRDSGVIERYELHELSVSAAEPFPFHIDGELMEAAADGEGRYRVTLRVLPRRLRFIVPGRFYRLFHPFEEQAEAPRNVVSE